MLLRPIWPFHHTSALKSLILVTHVWKTCFSAWRLSPLSHKARQAMLMKALVAKVILVWTWCLKVIFQSNHTPSHYRSISGSMMVPFGIWTVVFGSAALFWRKCISSVFRCQTSGFSFPPKLPQWLPSSGGFGSLRSLISLLPGDSRHRCRKGILHLGVSF